MTFKNGCHNDKYFADLYLGFQLYKFVMGIVAADFPRPKTQVGILIDLGFDLGEVSKDIVQWKAQFLIIGSGKFSCAKVKLAVGFKVLPDPAWPKGFAGSIVALVAADGKVKTEEALAQQSLLAKEQELEAAVEAAEQPEAKIWAGIERIVHGLKHLPPVQLEPLMTQLVATQEERDDTTHATMQNTSAVQSTSTACDPKSCCCVGPLFLCPEEIGLYAGVALDLCLTCAR